MGEEKNPTSCKKTHQAKSTLRNIESQLKSSAVSLNDPDATITVKHISYYQPPLWKLSGFLEKKHMYDAEFYKYNVFFHNYKGTSKREIVYNFLLKLLDNCLMWLHWEQADLYTSALF